MLRAAARKHQLPLSMYLVGTDPYLRYYLYLMQGFQEIDFYQYGPYSNVGPAWGEDRGTLLQIGKATREIAPYEELLCAARRRPTRAALLVAYTTDVMQKHGPGFGPERQGLYLALHHSGIPVDVVGETDLVNDNLLQQYSVLYVTDPVVRLDVQRKILDWVRGGGHLWAGAGALGWDEYGRISRVLWPAFGVQEYDVRVQPAIGWGLPFFSPRSIRIRYHPRGLLKASGGAGALSLPHDVIAWGIRGNLPPSTGKVLARFDDGKPGALQNQYGKGMVWTIGVLAGEAYARRHWRLGLPPARLDCASGTAERALVATAAAAAGVSPPVKLSVPGLYSSVLDAPGATLVFLVNASTRPVKQLTVALAGAETVGKVESLRQGILPHRVEQGRLVVDVPLQDVELLVLRRK